MELIYKARVDNQRIEFGNLLYDLDNGLTLSLVDRPTHNAIGKFIEIYKNNSEYILQFIGDNTKYVVDEF